jgi:hypothetical protein
LLFSGLSVSRYYLIAHEWLHSEALWETEHNTDTNISLVMVYEDYMTLSAFEKGAVQLNGGIVRLRCHCQSFTGV